MSGWTDWGPWRGWNTAWYLTAVSLYAILTWYLGHTEVALAMVALGLLVLGYKRARSRRPRPETPPEEQP